MGGGGVDAPSPSPEEKDLQKQQAALLKEQTTLLQQSKHEQELLAPILYGQLGIKPKYDEHGTLTGYEEIPNELKGLQDEAQKGLFQRTIQALHGDLPADPGLMTNLASSEANLRESLRKSLGPDYAASTAGSKAMSDFEERKQNVIAASKRGDISTAEGLALSSSQLKTGQTGQTISQILGVGPQGTAGLANQYGAGSSAYNGPLQILQQNRNMQMQADEFNVQNNPMGQIMGGVGQLAGTLGSAAIFMSSEETKEDLEEIDTADVVETLKDLPIFKWRYKGDKNTHMGPMAEKFSDAFGVGDRKTIHMADVAGVFLSVAKELAKKAA